MKSSILILACALFLLGAASNSFAGSTTLDLSAEKKAVQKRLEEIKKRKKAIYDNCVFRGIKEARVYVQENNIDATEKEIENHVVSQCSELL